MLSGPAGSSSERIVSFLFASAVFQAGLCVDLQQAGVQPMIDGVRVRTLHDHPMYGPSLELAAVFGMGYILDEAGPEGQFARAAADRGIPAVDPEPGGCPGWDDDSIKKDVHGLWNVLYHYGLMDGTPTIPSTQEVVTGFVVVAADEGELSTATFRCMTSFLPVRRSRTCATSLESRWRRCSRP